MPVFRCLMSIEVALHLCLGGLGPLRWLCTCVSVPWVHSGGFVPVSRCLLGPLRWLCGCLVVPFALVS